MDDVTQQNAALVEQASAASQSLQEQAQTLNQLVTRFVLTESGATPVIKPAPASHNAPQPGRWHWPAMPTGRVSNPLPSASSRGGLSPTDEFFPALARATLPQRAPAKLLFCEPC